MEPRKGHFLSFVYQKINQNVIRLEKKSMDGNLKKINLYFAHPINWRDPYPSSGLQGTFFISTSFLIEIHLSKQWISLLGSNLGLHFCQCHIRGGFNM